MEQTPEIVTRRTFSVREVAATLGISVGFARLLIGRGHLRVVRVGRRVLVPAPEDERLLNEGTP